MLEEETNEEIEEMRELLYNLLKDYSAGVTSEFLEEQYNKKYVQTGITKPLPKNWLLYAKQADEFKVKQLTTFTMLYLTNTDSINLSKFDKKSLMSKEIKIDAKNNTEELKEEENNKIIKNITDLEPISLISMPIGVSVQVYIVLANDPDNIHIRLHSWDPLPDYLNSALMRIPDTEHNPPSQIFLNQILAAFINDKWERVKIVRKSKKFFKYWVVFAIDVGFYHIIHESNLRSLSVAVEAFKKIFLAKIKLSGIKPIEANTACDSNTNCKTDFYWSREAQQFVADQLKNGLNIKLIAKSSWVYEKNLNIPFAKAKLIVDGKDLGNLMVSEQLAQPE